MREALKTIFLVNASIAAAFGLFIELLKLCSALDVSPWLTPAAYVALFVWWWLSLCRPGLTSQNRE
jgi:hypothetical protein